MFCPLVRFGFSACRFCWFCFVFYWFEVILFWCMGWMGAVYRTNAWFLFKLKAPQWRAWRRRRKNNKKQHPEEFWVYYETFISVLAENRSFYVHVIITRVYEFAEEITHFCLLITGIPRFFRGLVLGYRKASILRRTELFQPSQDSLMWAIYQMFVRFQYACSRIDVNNTAAGIIS